MKIPAHILASVALSSSVLVATAPAQSLGGGFDTSGATPAVRSGAGAVLQSPTTARVIAPPSTFDGVTGYGGAVDADDVRVIIATGLDVAVLNTQTFAFETLSLLASTGVSFSEVHDVALEGQRAVVAHDGLTSLFTFDGASWNLDTPALTSGTDASEVEVLNGIAWVAISASSLTQLRTIDLSGGRTIATANTLEELVSLSVGQGPTGPRAILATQVDGARRVQGYETPLLGSLGDIATGVESSGLGDAVAVDDVWWWVGRPLDDTGAVDAGAVELFFDDGAGGFTSAGSVFSQEAGDEFGRVLAIDDDLLIASERNANIIPGAVDGVGAARLARLDDGAWTFTGEIVHSNLSTFTMPSDFAGAIALDGDRVVFGEPGANTVIIQPLPSTAQITNDASPALPGVMGDPIGGAFGITSAGAPFQIEARNAPPNAQAFLIVGTTEALTPLKGGVLYPTPDLVFTTLSTDANGELLVPFPWLDDVPLGFEAFLQWWFPDASSPTNVSATGGFAVRRDP